jgi:hypothetical protein
MSALGRFADGKSPTPEPRGGRHGGDLLKFRERNEHKMASMICPTCQHSERPGFVMSAAGASRFMPCPTCDGSRIASCCDGAVPCDEDVIDQRVAIDDVINRQAKGDPDMLARRHP